VQIVKQFKQFPFFPIVDLGKVVRVTFLKKSFEHNVVLSLPPTLKYVQLLIPKTLHAAKHRGISKVSIFGIHYPGVNVYKHLKRILAKYEFAFS